MKTQVTLTIDADIKKKFQAIAKEMGANMSSLTNMYYAHVVRTGSLDASQSNQDNDIELGFIPYEYLSSQDKVMYEKIHNTDKSNFINI